MATGGHPGPDPLEPGAGLEGLCHHDPVDGLYHLLQAEKYLPKLYVR